MKLLVPLLFVGCAWCLIGLVWLSANGRPFEAIFAGVLAALLLFIATIESYHD
jgi:hypothetical protein